MGDALSDGDVRDEVIIFLIAGQATTGSALASPFSSSVATRRRSSAARRGPMPGSTGRSCEPARLQYLSRSHSGTRLTPRTDEPRMSQARRCDERRDCRDLEQGDPGAIEVASHVIDQGGTTGCPRRAPARTRHRQAVVETRSVASRPGCRIWSLPSRWCWRFETRRATVFPQPPSNK